jgi:methylamine---glutamate N-methyltransferase subunit B
LPANAVNLRLRELMQDGYGTVVIKDPGAKHSIAVGILNRLNLIIEGSLGYFGLGLIDGPNVRISGRVGWSCAENMMSGTILIEKNAGSQFGAAIRGGDLVCRGNVGSRTGIDMKGGTIIVGGDTGAFTGFMMQRGRMVICGNAGKNLGDSMYDGSGHASLCDARCRPRCRRRGLFHLLDVRQRAQARHQVCRRNSAQFKGVGVAGIKVRSRPTSNQA